VDFQTSVTIIINDLNDEKPRFTQSKYTFTLSTNRVQSLNSTQIGSVFAMDLDKEDQDKLKFKSTDTRFALIPRKFGECAIECSSSLGQNNVEYSFEIVVTDLKGQMAQSQIVVRFESRPQFDELKWSHDDAFSSSMKENSPPGTQLLGVSIQPIGLASGVSATIGYKLTEPNDFFEIDNTTGVNYLFFNKSR
jgi:hypothetical protein